MRSRALGIRVLGPLVFVVGCAHAHPAPPAPLAVAASVRPQPQMLAAEPSYEADLDPAPVTNAEPAATRGEPEYAAPNLAPSAPDDGESARQNAMFAPKGEKQDASQIAAWLRSKGVAARTNADIATLMGRSEDAYECDRHVRLAAGLDVLVCHHSYVRGDWASFSDWVFLAPAAGRLVEVFRGPDELGANDFVDATTLGPYVRLTLEIGADGRSLQLVEAAPGVCADALARALKLRGRDKSGLSVAEVVERDVARVCASAGTYVLREGRFVAAPRAPGGV